MPFTANVLRVIRKVEPYWVGGYEHAFLIIGYMYNEGKPMFL